MRSFAIPLSALITGISAAYYNELQNILLNTDKSDKYHYPTDFTRGIIPKPFHSHNDYWRDVPFYTGLSYGAVSTEADVWLINGTLYVGSLRIYPKSIQTSKPYLIYLLAFVHATSRAQATTYPQMLCRVTSNSTMAHYHQSIWHKLMESPGWPRTQRPNFVSNPSIPLHRPHPLHPRTPQPADRIHTTRLPKRRLRHLIRANSLLLHRPQNRLAGNLARRPRGSRIPPLRLVAHDLGRQRAFQSPCHRHRDREYSTL